MGTRALGERLEVVAALQKRDDPAAAQRGRDLEHAPRERGKRVRLQTKKAGEVGSVVAVRVKAGGEDDQVGAEAKELPNKRLATGGEGEGRGASAALCIIVKSARGAAARTAVAMYCSNARMYSSADVPRVPSAPKK